MSTLSEMVVIIRPSFKKICGRDACRAALFNHLLYRLARKARGVDSEAIRNGECYWYGTAEQICKDMDEDTWCVNKIRKEIKELVKSGLIGQRRNPRNGWDQTRHYYISEEQGKVLKEKAQEVGVCLQHIGLPPDIFHLLNMVNASTLNGKCNCQIDEIQLPNTANPITINGNAIPKGTTKSITENTNQEREETRTPDAHEPVQVDVPTVTSPSPSSSSSQQGEIHGIPDSDAHSHAGSAHHDIGRTLVHPPASSGDTHRTEEAHQQEIASYSPETRTDTGMQENEGKVEQPPLVEVPLSEPDMTGKWSAEKCVQYDEWTQGKRYATPTERNAQLAVARQFQHDLPDLTLERYKLVFDDWHTWWKSKGKGWFHVSDLAVKQQNKITRLKNALNRLDAPPETNIRRLPSSTTTRRYNEPTPEEYAEVSETERRQRENFEKNGGLARLEQMKAERLAARRA